MERKSRRRIRVGSNTAWAGAALDSGLNSVSLHAERCSGRDKEERGSGMERFIDMEEIRSEATGGELQKWQGKWCICVKGREG